MARHYPCFSISFDCSKDDLVDVLRKYGDVCAFVSSSLVKSNFQLQLAAALTDWAFTHNQNIARTKALEFLLWMTTEREVHLAIHKNMMTDDQSGFIVFFDSGYVDAVLDDLAVLDGFKCKDVSLPTIVDEDIESMAISRLR